MLFQKYPVQTQTKNWTWKSPWRWNIYSNIYSDTFTMLGLCRKISAGKSCMMTSHRSSHVVRTKLGLLLLRELFKNNNIIQWFLRAVSFMACWKGLNDHLDQLSALFDQNFIPASRVHVLPLTFHLMTEYVCLCLSVWATGRQKTSDTWQTRALPDTRKI